MNDKVLSLIQEWEGQGVLTRFDAPTGTWIFICLHDNTLGPYMGGTRIKVYAALEEALQDAMRLAVGMTSKWAGIGVPAGGGKAVLAIPRPLEGEERRGLLARYGRLVNSLGGAFQTGEDLGTSPADMEHLARYAPYVHGFHPDTGKKIDPGPYTARGVFVGLKAALQAAFGSDDPGGRTVLVQGIGNVGWELGRLLVAQGARVLVSDVDEARVKRACEELGTRAVAPDAVYETPCDVYAPCALGATLNRDTIPRLACRVVAGSANNQLAEPEDATRLHERGILYVPDYVINAGGALSFGLLERGAHPEGLFDEVEKLGTTVAEILAEAAKRDESPLQAAQRRVVEALARARA